MADEIDDTDEVIDDTDGGTESDHGDEHASGSDGATDAAGDDDLEGDFIDSQLAEKIRAHSKKQAARIAKLEKTLSKVADEYEATRFERAFDALPSEMKSVVESDKRKKAVREEMTKLKAVYPDESEASLMRKAVGVLFHEQIASQSGKKVADAIEKRNGQAIARPAGRKAVAPLSGDGKKVTTTDIANRLAAYMDEKGYRS